MKLMAAALHKYDYLYSDSLYSFRQNRKNADLFRKIAKLPDREKLYVLKTDISSYGSNVDPDILLKDLEPIFKKEDEAIYRFFAWILSRNMYYRNGKLIKENTGAISGIPLTSFWENIYLLSADEKMREKSVLYCRYCDDIAVFVRTKEEAQECKKILKEMLAEKGLKFNEEKTVIYEPGDDVELLGIKVTGEHFDISEYSLNRIKFKMRHKRDKLLRRIQYKKMSKEAAMNSMIWYYNRYFFGIKRFDKELNWVAWSFPILTREKSLKEIDAYVQDCIRIVGSSKKSDSKYRVTYKNMKAHGYKCLVHAYYHGYDVMEDQDEIINRDTETSRGKCAGSSGDDAVIL